MKDFLIKMLTNGSGVSSKRVCGAIGFLVICYVVIYCTMTGTSAPALIDTFIYCVVTLLGLDSVMKPFVKNE